MKKSTLNRVAKGAMGVALLTLIASVYTLSAGPLRFLTERGQEAAAHADLSGFAMYAGLGFLAQVALPLIFGGIAICVMAAYLAFEKMQAREAESCELVTVHRQAKQ